MRHKFETLDGLRGIAAFAVVAWHRRDWFGGDGFLGHAYLAVDFFFMLSGFVIAHAYTGRLSEGGGRLAFLRDRLIRLHPLLFAGAALGCLTIGLQAVLESKPLPQYPALTSLSAFVPVPALWSTDGEAFPINNPEWSLFWELVANAVFALFARQLTSRRLAAIIAISALVMIYCSVISTGFKGGRTYDELWQGLPRVALSFSIGVLLLRLFRRGWRAKLPNAPLAIAVILLASFALLPVWHAWSVVYDPAVVILLYPMLILWGADTVPKMPRSTLLAGAISYPLYILHAPLLQLVSGARRAILREATGQPEILGGIISLVIVVLASFAALKLYDEPVRGYLRRRFGSARHRDPASTPTGG